MAENNEIEVLKEQITALNNEINNLKQQAKQITALNNEVHRLNQRIEQLSVANDSVNVRLANIEDNGLRGVVRNLEQEQTIQKLKIRKLEKDK
ncbi:hypothetical protein CPIN18021_0284 [Campylobacter pinnipediorum subsp. caledonicus]|uniref:Uncharacterized protein n=1 Tax=Campylobacter pinnipediorum subsp. caledonicus TaxID=1874362 RepID=A0A1S6U5W9_9BACT|nr:DUF5320 domain-containing protein [Campylobacter pinnipediorum]AQW85546.1 hypothetical protein CPIN18020_0305 [Campylobacter pinnipediorum subsp. caledonicus]AQW87131.1 hypothetical protein CPIN18021_0284 [Campylobacter pinnipediorum subsp. caledonicus]OPA71829.1 hypothetical protein BB381_06745 [Campylobacter pinnipediorum subsp. caledonicus]